MSRPDYFKGVPFPAILPQVSLSYKDATLVGMYTFTSGTRKPSSDFAGKPRPCLNSNIPIWS